MAAIVITKNETIVFIVSFLFLFAAQSSALILFAAISLLTLFFLKRKEIYFFWSIIAPRINGEAPILTYLLSLAREEGPGNKELPDLMEIRIPFIPPLIFVFKSEYIKRILNTEPDNFPSDGETGPMAKITGNSGKNILLSPGPPSHHWHRYREITSPINKDRFGSLSLVSEMFQATWSTAQELSQKHLGPKLGQDLNLFYEIFHIMIPAHNRALFGEEFQRKFSYSQQSHDMFDIITETGKQLKFDFCPPTVKKAYFGKLSSVAASVKNMMKESTSKFMKPLLDANRAGKLTDEELFSNVMVFEYAQAPLHVTFWLLYSLALHPEEEKRVVSEIANLLALGPMTYERLPEFKYLSKVVSETLRIYPGVGLMQVRTSKYNTTFGSHFISQGSYIFLCNYLIQRNASYWSNPDDFIPSREGIDPALYGQNLSYIPFGNGPRQCQGQYFAQDFIKVTVIAILRDYVIRLSPGQKAAEPTEIGFLRPSHPVYVKLEKRILPSPQTPVPEPEQSTSSLARPFTSSSSISSIPSIPSSSLSSLSRLPSSSLSSLSRLPSHQSQKKFPPMLSRNKAANLVSQSQVFRDTFVSIGRLKNTKDLLVLYGSQTGNARGLASRVVKMASLCKLHSTLTVLSELDVSTVKQYKAVVVVTATYGDGGAPENAEKFENWLEHETSTDIFKGVPYAVLALGSTMYPFPFRFGTFLSRRFAEMGAKQLIPDERIDEIRYHQNEVYTKWSSKLFSALAKNSNVSNLDVSARDLVTKNTMLGFQNFDFNIMSPQFSISFTSKSLKKETRAQYPTKVAFAKVSKNELVNSEPSNEIYSLELSFESGELSFQTGDNVLVYPTNPEDIVERLTKRLGFEKDKLFEIIQDENSTADLSCSQGKNKCTLNIALSYYYDITSPPSSSMLQFLAMNCADTDEQKTLLSYNSNYRTFLTRNYTILDLLENAESFSIEGDKKEEKLAVFLGLLGPIKQRHYSVANFPDSSPNTVRVIYKVVSYTTKEGVAKQGLCTKYLKEKTLGEKIPISIVRAKKFKLPEKANTPIILVGAGSGIAPYFGFLEQRNYQKNNGEQLGKAILVHGCRTEADFAQKNKVETAISEGLLSNLWPAYSRQEGAPKTHIQDIFEQKGEEIWRLLEEGGIVYMCGDISVAVSIRDALVRVAQKHGHMGAFRANNWLSKLSKEGRLRNDEWGITTSSGEHIIRAARLKLWRKSILAILAFTRKH